MAALRTPACGCWRRYTRLSRWLFFFLFFLATSSSQDADTARCDAVLFWCQLEYTCTPTRLTLIMLAVVVVVLLLLLLSLSSTRRLARPLP